MDWLLMNDIASIDDDFKMDDASEMHESVSFVNQVPKSVSCGFVLYDNRYKGDPRPYKVIDMQSGRYLRGFASYAEAAEFASNPRMCA